MPAARQTKCYIGLMQILSSHVEYVIKMVIYYIPSLLALRGQLDRETIMVEAENDNWTQTGKYQVEFAGLSNMSDI